MNKAQSTKKIIIIGGGIIGLCTGYYAARRGHRVTILEKGPFDRDGCSFGNAGMIVPSHFIPLAAPGMVSQGLKWMWHPESPFSIQPRLNWDLIQWGWLFYRAAHPTQVARAAPLLRDLSLASRRCYEELAEITGNNFGLVKKGLLMLCRSAQAMEEEAKMAKQAQALGLQAEVLDARQTTKLDPDIQMDIAGSVYFPQDCYLAPGHLMAELQARLADLGACFRWDTEVTGWRLSGDRIDAVQGSGGEFTADEYVVCGGAWSSVLARDLNLRLPLQAGKGYSLTLPHPRQLPTICAILTEARVAVTPMNGQLRFGGTLEICGLNEVINTRRVHGMIKSISGYYPDFTWDDFKNVPVWRGLRPCSPDGLPYIGRCSRYTNLSFATGHAMMGISLGPITGRLMAEVLSDESPSMDLHLLHPDRFGARREIDY